MRKCISILVCLCCLLSPVLSACGKQEEATIVKTYETSPSAEAGDGLRITTKYYEMSDGTWSTDTHSYKYRLEITGRMSHAAEDSTFLYLSNTEDITFDQAWKATGLSSDTADYFDEEDAKLVGWK